MLAKAIHPALSILSFFLTCIPRTAHQPALQIQRSHVKGVIPGNITLGGLIPMHLRGKGGHCSFINSNLGMETLEVLLYSVDRINANASLLPANLTLGVKAFDTCGIEMAALDQAVKEFVLGEVWHSTTKPCNNHTRPVIGVIGPAYSYEAVHVARFLELFEIPLISYGATSTELSDKTKYEFFSRTVPSDVLQTRAILDLLLYFNWTYVAVVYSDETYGNDAFENLKKEARKNGICFATHQKVPLEYDKQKYEEIVSEILSADPVVRVVVFMCVEMALHPLFKEMQKRSNKRTLQLVGSDILGTVVNRELQELPGAALHVLFFNLPKAAVDDFRDYFLGLTAHENTRNPWFKAFFANVANCSFGARTTITNMAPCDPRQTLGDLNYSNFLGDFSLMPPVVDGVYAFAHAIRRIHEDYCGGGNSKKTCVAFDKIPGHKLLDIIRTQTFQSPSGSTVKFNRSGDVDGRYDLYYLGQASDGSYKNTMVGEWRAGRLNLKPVSDWQVKFAPIPSHCSETCGANEIPQRLAHMPRCCWQCVPCAPETIAVNGTTCQSCPQGYMPDRHRYRCIRIKIIYYTLDGHSISLYVAVVPMVMSSFGITAVCLVTVVFAKHRSTPLVKASGRELSCLLLCGVFLSFLFPFAAISKPTPWKCFWQFVLDSFPFTISYVAIAMKTNRIYRIFDPHRTLSVPPSCVRPKSQIMLSLGLISFQAVLLISMMLLDVPREQFVYPSHTETYLTCATSDTQVIVSQVYNIILLVVCTYYAYKTRDTPRNFNEARYIAFAMYGSVVSLSAFVVVFFVTSKRSTAVDKLAVHCLRVTFMALVLLVCFFAPKTYIIVCKSKENVNHETVNRESIVAISCEHERGEDGKFRCHGEPCSMIGILEVNKIKSPNSRSTQTDPLT